MIPPDLGSPAERRLLRAFRALDGGDRDTLLAFAEFLHGRAAGGDADADTSAVQAPEPVPEPRPQQETVIAAIKRLRRVYPMLDGGKMLHETSALMAAHVLHGRAAAEVIDELEALFEARWIEHRDAAD
jgi:hypothetical protein